MTITKVSVPEVHCDHCIAAIEGAVSKEAGVEHVAVDLGSKQVTVQHDPGITGVPQLVKVIEDQGYDVESFEEVSSR